jgi:outer membrane protein assembly factor BamB
MRHYGFRMPFLMAVAAGLLLAAQTASRAGDWPGWRGPTGLGHTDEKDLPLTWDGKTGKNILWKAALYGDQRANSEASSPGWSCPIVWRDRVFITTAEWPAELLKEPRKGETARKDIARHHVLCYQASDGKLLWDTLVPPGKCLVEAYYHGYATPTPVTDGEHVFALFGSAVIAALDFDGKIVWREELPRQRDADYGVCSSLVLHEDSVILVGIAEAGLRALHKKTGKVKWEKKHREKTRFSTPILVRIDGRIQMIQAASGWVQGIDPATGDLLWSCRAPANKGTPVFGSGLVFVDPGEGGKATGTAIDPTGKGDVSNTHVKWQVKGVPDAAGVSPIIVGDYVYRAGNPGLLKCWKLADGALVYEERLARVSPCSSPIATPDGRIYLASSGRSYVVKAGPKFEVLATNELNDGPEYITPAVSGGRIFIKGKAYLWCIGKTEAASKLR